MIRTIGLLALFFLLWISTVSATEVRKFSLDDLARQSDVLALATVESVRVEVDPETKRPYTYTTIRSESVLKGAPSEALTFRQFGGTVGKLGMWIPGNVRFKQGDRAVFFLKSLDKNGLYYLKGMAQGAFLVREIDGVEMAAQKLDGLRLAEVSGKGEKFPVASEPIRMPLKDLLETVRKIVRQMDVGSPRP